MEAYSAILIFLNEVGVEITKKHLEVIGDKKSKIPLLNFEWLEIILGFYLFDDQENFTNHEEHKEKLKNKLKRNGLLNRRSINFRYNQKINKSLSSSLSKLQSIDNIVDVEHNTLGNGLRMLILTDFIRKEFLSKTTSNQLELKQDWCIAHI